MTLTPAALTLIKTFEQGPRGGFAAQPYRCPAGHETVGWGHVLKPNDRLAFPLTAEEADALLQADLERFAASVNLFVRVPLTPAMFDALVCFAFNIGSSSLANSTLLRRLNAGDYVAAAEEFLKWDKARNPHTGKKEALAGLTRRRKAERTLFLSQGVTPHETQN